MLKLTGYIIGTTGIVVGDIDVIYRSTKLKDFPGDLWKFDFYPNPKSPNPHLPTWILDISPEATRPVVKLQNIANVRALIEHEAAKYVFTEGYHEIGADQKGWFFGYVDGFVHKHGQACFYGKSYGRIEGRGRFYEVSKGVLEDGEGEAWFCDCSHGGVFGGVTLTED